MFLHNNQLQQHLTTVQHLITAELPTFLPETLESFELLTCQLTLEDKFCTVSRWPVLTGGPYLQQKTLNHVQEVKVSSTKKISLTSTTSSKRIEDLPQRQHKS